MAVVYVGHGYNLVSFLYNCQSFGTSCLFKRVVVGTYRLVERLWGGLYLKPPKFGHIFVVVITFISFFCADTFDTNMLPIVCALR